MSLTLRSAITATQTTVDIAGSDTLSEGDVLSVDSEYIEIRGSYPAVLQYGESAHQLATVKRGVQGSHKATHAAAAALTAVLPGSPGGSGLPAGGDVGDVVTNTAPGEGEWAAPTVGDSVLPDPGTVWEAETVVSDDYRLASGPRVFSALGGGTTGTELPDFDSPLAANGTVADGDFSWRFIGFIGEVPFASLTQTLPVIAIPQSGPMTDDLDANGFAVTGFSTLEPESPPEVPASPTDQDIVDALVTLGLITQAGGG